MILYHQLYNDDYTRAYISECLLDLFMTFVRTIRTVVFDSKLPDEVTVTVLLMMNNLLLQ
jgi:hypothetical protein